MTLSVSVCSCQPNNLLIYIFSQFLVHRSFSFLFRFPKFGCFTLLVFVCRITSISVEYELNYLSKIQCIKVNAIAETQIIIIENKTWITLTSRVLHWALSIERRAYSAQNTAQSGSFYLKHHLHFIQYIFLSKTLCECITLNLDDVDEVSSIYSTQSHHTWANGVELKWWRNGKNEHSQFTSNRYLERFYYLFSLIQKRKKKKKIKKCEDLSV